MVAHALLEDRSLALLPAAERRDQLLRARLQIIPQHTECRDFLRRHREQHERPRVRGGLPGRRRWRNDSPAATVPFSRRGGSARLDWNGWCRSCAWAFAWGCGRGGACDPFAATGASFNENRNKTADWCARTGSPYFMAWWQGQGVPSGLRNCARQMRRLRLWLCGLRADSRERIQLGAGCNGIRPTAHRDT